MASLMIRDLPPELHNRLKDRAKANRRSLNKEALVILEEALIGGEWPLSLEDIDRLRVCGAHPLTQKLLDEARQDGRP